MTEPIDDKRLTEIKVRYEKSTSGEWIHAHDFCNKGQCNIIESNPPKGGGPELWCIALNGINDADFIANVHQDVSYLLGEIDKLREGKKTLRYTNKSLLEDIVRLRSEVHFCPNCGMYCKQCICIEQEMEALKKEIKRLKSEIASLPEQIKNFEENQEILGRNSENM